MKSAFVLVGIFLGAILFSLVFLENFKNQENKASVKINNVVFFVDVVKNSADRERGLSGREKLKDDEAMLFLFESPAVYGFWMKDMKFAIDIIWIKDDKIVGMAENIDSQIGVPESELKIYYPPEPINKVLELSAGTVDRLGFKIGNEVGYNK